MDGVDSTWERLAGRGRLVGEFSWLRECVLGGRVRGFEVFDEPRDGVS